MIDIEAYLERIDYHGSLIRSADTLRQLQAAHLQTVPFENLSIHAGEPIVLSDEALFDKIVVRRRGGFCYELNGLFAALLCALGFDVAMLSAAVMKPHGEFGPEFGHMTLMVTLEDRWLVDVGFGDSFLEPLILESGQIQVQGERAYRLDIDVERFVLWQRDRPDEWNAQYRFDLTPHEYDNYAKMCHFHQTSPQSHFTQSRVCSRATPSGRITLSGKQLITTRNGQRQEQELKDAVTYDEALREYFGIVLDR